jgi:tetratricopeptide (TPR) repeat protein
LPGTVLGTAGYLSPEQARGEPATAASDRYSLGVVAFELLTGRRPFAGDTPVTEALAHVNSEIPSARELEPGLPPGVDAVLARALAKNPSERPRSCAELVADLRDAFTSPPAPTVIDTGAPTRRVVHRSRRPYQAAVVLGAAALLLAGLALAVFLGVTRDAGVPERGATGAPTDRSTTTTTTQQTVESTPSVDAAALDAMGYKLMLAGDYQQALPLFEQAVAALSGSGSKTEAYASYNLAYTRFALERCDGVLALLNRSESIQGHRKPIDRLRREAEKTCLGGQGNGRGKKNEEEGD